VLSCCLLYQAAGAAEPERREGRPAAGRVLIRLAAEDEEAAVTNLENIGFKFIRSLRSIGAQIWQTPRGLPVARAVRIARRMPGIGAVEAAVPLSTAEAPNDPEYFYQYAPPKMHMPEAWHVTTGDKNVVVAVIDSGVKYDHPDLAENIYVNSAEVLDGIDNDGNGFVDDIHGWDFRSTGLNDLLQDNDPSDFAGHGTGVAGVAGAVGNNATGIAGVAWQVQILPLKIAGDLVPNLDSFSAIEAIDYAVAQGAQVINASYIAQDYRYGVYQGDRFSRLHLEALQAAQDAGVVLVAAAGNSDQDRNIDEKHTYPSCYNLANIISVAATTDDDSLRHNSNYGAKSVDLAAPGENIYTTSKTGAYETESGTSFAAPQVAGIAALMRVKFPQMNVRKLRLMIMEGVDVIASHAGKTVTGGRVNAHASLTGRIPWTKRYTAAPPEPIRIPDNDPDGIAQTITVTDNETIRAVSVLVTFDHSYVGDVGLTIQSPSGTVNTLKVPRDDEYGGSFSYIYDTQWDFRGESAAGTWTLRAYDSRPLNTGSLVSWGLEIYVDGPGEDINGDGQVDILDLIAVRNALYGSPGREDVTGDGAVNVLDLISVRNMLYAHEDQ